MRDLMREVSWEVIPPSGRGAHMHMALDEVLLEQVISGAAQARRRGFVLHHTTIAHTMDVELLPRLIRVGRERIAEKGIRSAEKAVSPLSWFTSLSCSEMERDLCAYFERTFGARISELTEDDLTDAQRLVESKYATAEWINRLP